MLWHVGLFFPELSEKYTAQLNSGAFLNGIKLSVSQCLTVSDAIAGFGDFSVGKGSEKKNRFRSELIHLLGNNTLRVRMLGSAAMQLAWLAAGRMDISVTLSNKAWDVQAGVLLVREAGGEVFDYNGEPHSFSSAYTLASSNPSLKQSLLNMLSACERNA